MADLDRRCSTPGCCGMRAERKSPGHPQVLRRRRARVPVLVRRRRRQAPVLDEPTVTAWTAALLDDGQDAQHGHRPAQGRPPVLGAGSLTTARFAATSWPASSRPRPTSPSCPTSPPPSWPRCWPPARAGSSGNVRDRAIIRLHDRDRRPARRRSPAWRLPDVNLEAPGWASSAAARAAPAASSRSAAAVRAPTIDDYLRLRRRHPLAADAAAVARRPRPGPVVLRAVQRPAAPRRGRAGIRDHAPAPAEAHRRRQVAVQGRLADRARWPCAGWTSLDMLQPLHPGRRNRAWPPKESRRLDLGDF